MSVYHLAGSDPTLCQNLLQKTSLLVGDISAEEAEVSTEPGTPDIFQTKLVITQNDNGTKFPMKSTENSIYWAVTSCLGQKESLADGSS